MSRRSLNVAVVFGALSAWACSVYSPGDLIGNGDTFDEGGSSTGGVGHGGATVTGGTGGNNPLGGTSSGGSLSGGSGGKAAGGTGGLAGSTAGGGASGGSSPGGAATGGKAPTGGGDTGGGETGGGGSTVTSGGAVNTGGKATGGVGGATTGGDATGGTVSYPPELIDDMEDGNQRILDNDKRDGAWYTAAGKGGVAEPAPGMALGMVEITGTPGPVGSTRAFYFKGSAGTEWGVSAAFDFIAVPANATKLPYDASAYKGITFWVKAAAASTTVVQLRVPIKDTSSVALGACMTMAMGCDNHFAAALPVTTAWKQVNFLWTALKQDPTWGYKVTAGFNKAQLVSVQFVIPIVTGATTPPSAEFWIDDIAFIP